MVNWQTLFMVSLRRQGSSSRYRYKFNMENITHQVFPRCKQAFKKANLSYEYCDLEGKLYNASLMDLQKMLLRDINAPRDHVFKIVRTDLVEKSSKKRIQHWEQIAPIFDHPLSLYENLLSEMDNDFKPSFEWQQLIEVRSRDDQLKLQRVVWPKSIFSNFCRGIGVKKNTYDRLLKQNNGEVPMFVNPANAKPLPLFQVGDDATIGEFDGIGIFPYFVVKHRAFFVTEVDKLKTKIISPLCNLNERKRTDKANAGRLLENEKGEPFYVDAKGAASRAADGNAVTLKQLLERSVSHKTLWSKQTNKDRTCPGDILRATILSNDFSIRQLRTEFCKNFILYNIFTILQRNKKSIRDFSNDNNVPSFRFNWNVWDSYIWKQYQEAESMTLPADQASLINYKTKYDSFLQDLQTYSTLVISEMKWNQFSIFQNNETSLSRFEHITLILQTILTKSKMIRIFQPNLYKFMQDDLRATLMELTGFTESINATIGPGFANEQSLQSANALKKLANQLLHFEQKIYAEKFRVNRPIQLRPLTLSTNFKIVILDKQNAIPEIFQTLLKFTTQITTYFVKDLSEVELHGHMHCIDKKMLDKSTFMYLYELKYNEDLKAVPPQKEKIVDNIIGLLSNDEEH
uniref:Cytochrome B pre-mRNA-processing protein 2 n=1 Tax=Saccharomyces paradoxus TaxID=27291 RepID=CBP2_SACPA|nr:RecName: Full=Cytochrome B pre-mRNA-processing protein 2 [Saccharomyces paradoxus]pir/S61597/ CBP2 protein - yeast (Saccharomyces sp.) (strain douglasii) [Saccharomyces sp.]CAA64148.1 CBP2 [Saccharomyces douglasii]